MKSTVGFVSKRGDVYLRKLLVHGARSALRTMPGKGDRTSVWAQRVAERSGHNQATVALANMNARVAWALLRYEQDYQARAA
jgi:transposase